MVYAARDRYVVFSFGTLDLRPFRFNRDVVIKAIRKGDEGKNEHDILLLLNSQPLRPDPANMTVPILDFLQYKDWHFAVMPCCYRCTKKPFLNASELLEFADQVMTVRIYYDELWNSTYYTCYCCNTHIQTLTSIR